jgi:hypothetical protein
VIGLMLILSTYNMIGENGKGECGAVFLDSCLF